MEKSGPLAPFPNYESFVQALKERIRAAQVRASLAINRELILLYWQIGKDILDRQKKEGWGTKVIDRLSVDLGRTFPEMTGFSARNLKYMRAFAEAWPDESIVQQVVAQLPWGHQVRILDSVKVSEEREWYVRQCIEHGWSRSVLVHQIDSALYHRQGKALTNFERTLPAPQSELARQLLKDPYNFDFLSLGSEMLERDLERGLIAHLRDLILELGKGFAFVGSQYHLEVGGQDFYIDLLFYHLRLRCFVAIDLKIEDFKPEFAGKMNFYLSAVDAQLRREQDQPSIGIILCRDKNELIVEYSLKDTRKPMGVAQYRTTKSLSKTLRKDLPTSEELSAEFHLLSLVQLRIDLERTLSAIIKSRGIEGIAPNASAGLLATILHRKRVIGTALMSDILRLTEFLNGIVHGEDVQVEDSRTAADTGNRILTELRAIH